MTAVQSPTLVFLLDVDNTLLDNDHVKEAIADAVEKDIGPERAARFWQLYEVVRRETGYVDFPTTVTRLSGQLGDPSIADQLNNLLQRFPFKDYLYPHALDTIGYLNTLGDAVILSDGDSVFQPFKIKESGIEAAVSGRVLVYVHKEEELEHVFEAYPADHYEAVDDKPRIVSALEKACPTTFTTVLVEQGKYARDAGYAPPPDYVIPAIGDLRGFNREQFLNA
jgi:FMN phosphatase YigB (HAD superfamily)